MVLFERIKNFMCFCINMSLKIFKGFNVMICLFFSFDGLMVGNYKYFEIICIVVIIDVS